MRILYKIYRNDGHGGPIDYTTPIAVTDQLTHGLALPSDGDDFAFGVRSMYESTGLTEANTDATVRLVLDDGGLDVTRAPSPPKDLTFTRNGAGPFVVRWYWKPNGLNDRPTHFQVKIIRIDPTNEVLADERVDWSPSCGTYRLSYEGPIAPGTYQVQATAHGSDLSSRESAQASLTTGQPQTSLQVDNLRARMGVGLFPIP